MRHLSRRILPLVTLLGVIAAALPTAWANPEAESVYVPSNFAWVHTVLLAIVWLFVAAILIGPVVVFFQPPPPPEPANGHDSHDAHDTHDSPAAHTDAGHH